MEEGFGFDDFSVELEDFEYVQVQKFDRIFDIGEGGSLAQKPPGPLRIHRQKRLALPGVTVARQSDTRRSNEQPPH